MPSCTGNPGVVSRRLKKRGIKQVPRGGFASISDTNVSGGMGKWLMKPLPIPGYTSRRSVSEFPPPRGRRSSGKTPQTARGLQPAEAYQMKVWPCLWKGPPKPQGRLAGGI